MKGYVTVFLFLCMLLPLGAVAKSVGGGDLLFTPSDPGVRQVLFSHEKHVMGRGINCTGCHYHIFQMAKGSYKMNMEKMTKGEFCGTCHNGTRAFDVKDPHNCRRCHV